MDPMQSSGNQSGQMGSQMPVMQPKRSIGTIIAIIVVVVLLIVGALYFWGQKVSTESAVQTLPSESSNAGTQEAAGDAAQAAPISSSDDINTLNSELEASGSGNVDLSELE